MAMPSRIIDQHYIIVFEKPRQPVNWSAPLRPEAAKELEGQLKGLGFATRAYSALEVTWRANGSPQSSGPLPAPEATALLKELLDAGYQDAATKPIETGKASVRERGRH